MCNSLVSICVIQLQFRFSSLVSICVIQLLFMFDSLVSICVIQFLTYLYASHDHNRYRFNSPVRDLREGQKIKDILNWEKMDSRRRKLHATIVDNMITTGRLAKMSGLMIKNKKIICLVPQSRVIQFNRMLS